METIQATKLKKGVKRLSLICGGLGVTIWGFLCFMEIIAFRHGSEEKIIMGFLFSFFLPWGILRAIPWVMEGFKGADERHSQDEIEQTGMEDSADNPTCPICNSNLVKAIIEQGGYGDWCYNCKKSLQKMQEEGIKEKESQDTNNEDSPTEAFPAFGDRMAAIEKRLKRMQWGYLFILILVIFCFTSIINNLTSRYKSRNKVLMAEGLIVIDKFGITRIEINTHFKSNKPYIKFLNDKGETECFISGTGLFRFLDVKSSIEQFDPPKTQVMPTYDELMKQAEREALYNKVMSVPDVKGTNPDAKLRKSVPLKPDKFIPDPQKEKLPAWEETIPEK